MQNNVLPMPKSTHADRIADNARVFDFALSDEDMQTIAALDQQTSAFFNHQDPAIVEMLSNLVRNV